MATSICGLIEDVQELDKNVMKNIAIIMLAVFLAFSAVVNVYYYVKNQIVISQGDDLLVFMHKFGSIKLVGYTHDASPPISMYQALKIALESDRWNTTNLQDMTVQISLYYGVFYQNQTGTGISLKPFTEVTQPVYDYSPVKQGDTTYRYVWEITVVPSGFNGLHITPYGLYFVDAQSGEIIPHAAIY